MDGSDLADGVHEGVILDGKYLIEGFLGTGGMGIVYAARHLALDERVAIKFLHAEDRDPSDAESRFLREARAAVKIKSEHVARVTDVGQLASGAPYMVMEYLAGEDLAEMLLRRGALAIEQAVDFVLQACEAVAEAHCLGIIHRDLKPANLFCIRRPDGALSIKVLDFGISKTDGASAPASAHDTGESANVVGSPYYMSPEQLSATKGVDVRTDLWSIGVSLYELLTAEKPFSGNTMSELSLAIVSRDPSSVREHRPDVPQGLAQVLERCLQRDRDCRYQNVAELATALAPFGSQQASSSVARILGILQSGRQDSSPVLLPAFSSGRGDTTKLPATSATWGHITPSHHRAQLLLAGLVASALVGFFLFSITRENGAIDVQPTPLISVREPDSAREPKMADDLADTSETPAQNATNEPHAPASQFNAAPPLGAAPTLTGSAAALPPRPLGGRHPVKQTKKTELIPSPPSVQTPAISHSGPPRRGIYEEME